MFISCCLSVTHTDRRRVYCKCISITQCVGVFVCVCVWAPTGEIQTSAWHQRMDRWTEPIRPFVRRRKAPTPVDTFCLQRYTPPSLFFSVRIIQFSFWSFASVAVTGQTLVVSCKQTRNISKDQVWCSHCRSLFKIYMWTIQTDGWSVFSKCFSSFLQERSERLKPRSHFPFSS